MKEMIEMLIDLLKEAKPMTPEKDIPKIDAALEALEEIKDETLTGEEGIKKLNEVMEKFNLDIGKQ